MISDELARNHYFSEKIHTKFKKTQMWSIWRESIKSDLIRAKSFTSVFDFSFPCSTQEAGTMKENSFLLRSFLLFFIHSYFARLAHIFLHSVDCIAQLLQLRLHPSMFFLQLADTRIFAG